MIPEITREQLDRLSLERGRPLLVLDADEVLVYFLRHFRVFLDARGWELDLTTYRLDAALKHRGEGRTATREEGLAFIDRFFAEETPQQEAIPGAAEAVARMAERAQVVVLTNLPHHARAARVGNLARHGLAYPVVSNSGGKGPVLAALAERTVAPVVFVDDSKAQIDSAAKHAASVRRLQLIGCDYAAPALPRSEQAERTALNWDEAAPWIRAALDG
ncbi:HAD family hydrolase [Pontivivens ytuae]|uniref:HAD family hydrolase n=1 Tax=Pontivivens ytuae TaxID=2789856 RepID=A0A7S9LRF5_9RHOB|nr:HAD family hydrolase [Pontivivens ytuae]QPH53370.1 HAD family hydrolase [Pontivivens ytuae]